MFEYFKCSPVRKEGVSLGWNKILCLSVGTLQVTFHVSGKLVNFK